MLPSDDSRPRKVWSDWLETGGEAFFKLDLHMKTMATKILRKGSINRTFHTYALAANWKLCD